MGNLNVLKTRCLQAFAAYPLFCAAFEYAAGDVRAAHASPGAAAGRTVPPDGSYIYTLQYI
jgi:hypothetical protein